MTDSHKNFADKLKELEQITAWFESEQVDLNEALEKFERGMELSNQLKKELHEVENRVEKIKQKFDGVSSVDIDDTPKPDSLNADSQHPDLFSN